MNTRTMLTRATGLAVLAAILLLGAVSVAAAAPAEFSNFTPAPGSSTPVSRPLISVRIYDPAGPRPDALWMKIDGRKVGARVRNVAANTIDYSFTPTTNLSTGNHSVEVSELNWAGARYTTNWSFRVGGTPPLLANPTPAPGTTVTTALPLISAKVTQGANGIVPTVILDGVPIVSTFDPATSLVTATPPSPLLDDMNHDVTVSVTNADGLSTSLPWSFYVLTKTRMPDTTQDDPCQTCHPTFPASHDMTNCDACHGYDGPIGGFYAPPDYHPDGEQSVYLSDCGRCHGDSFPTVPDHKSPPESYHRATTASDACKPCHVLDLLAEHYYREETNDCMLCHGSTDANVQSAIAGGNTDCLGCHDADHGGSHDSTINEQTLSGTYPGVGSYGPVLVHRLPRDRSRHRAREGQLHVGGRRLRQLPPEPAQHPHASGLEPGLRAGRLPSGSQRDSLAARADGARAPAARRQLRLRGLPRRRRPGCPAPRRERRHEPVVLRLPHRRGGAGGQELRHLSPGSRGSARL